MPLGVGDFTGGKEQEPGGGAPAPAPAPGDTDLQGGINDAIDQQQGQQSPGKIQDDPVFQSLPRAIQKQVESGQLSLDEAVQQAAKAGGGAGQPAPQVPGGADQTNQGSPGGGGPSPNAQTQPNVPIDFAGGPDRLTAGQVLEGGRSGRDTFARPGSQGFQAFSGQEFNPFLLRPEARGVAGGAALSARDALQTGEAGRQVLSSGGAGGFSLGGADDPFLRDLIGG
jgi:hypothetical protein